MFRITIISQTLVFLLLAYVPKLTEDQFDIATVSMESGVLFEAPVGKTGSIESRHWPEGIKRLKPRRVYKNKNGIYIVLYVFFVEERGLFIPLSTKTIVQEGGGSDPAYHHLGKNIYSY